MLHLKTTVRSMNEAVLMMNISISIFFAIFSDWWLKHGQSVNYVVSRILTNDHRQKTIMQQKWKTWSRKWLTDLLTDQLTDNLRTERLLIIDCNTYFTPLYQSRTSNQLSTYHHELTAYDDCFVGGYHTSCIVCSALKHSTRVLLDVLWEKQL